MNPRIAQSKGATVHEPSLRTIAADDDPASSLAGVPWTNPNTRYRAAGSRAEGSRAEGSRAEGSRVYWAGNAWISAYSLRAAVLMLSFLLIGLIVSSWVLSL